MGSLEPMLSTATGSQSALHLHVLNKDTANEPVALCWLFTWPLSDYCAGLRCGAGCCRRIREGMCTSSKSKNLREVFTRDCINACLRMSFKVSVNLRATLRKLATILSEARFMGAKNLSGAFSSHISIISQSSSSSMADFASIDSSAAASDLSFRYCRGLGSPLTLRLTGIGFPDSVSDCSSNGSTFESQQVLNQT
jgi:hypothetical protein